MAAFNGSVYGEVNSVVFQVDPFSCTSGAATNEIGKVFECDVCHKTFARKSQMVQHYRVHTGEKPFECNECGKRFAHSQTWRDHLKVHSSQKPYSCDICGIKFHNYPKLRQHKKKHENSRKRLCVICGEIFSRPKTYENHIEFHFPDESDQNVNKTSNNGIAQPDAEPGFVDINGGTQNENLPTHNTIAQNIENEVSEEQRAVNGMVTERQHDGLNASVVEEFSCKVCYDTFPTKELLLDHGIVHIIADVHKCGACDKVFCSKKVLEEHGSIHVGEKPFLCEICGHRMKAKGTWYEHVRNHKRGKSHCCDVCGKRFCQKSVLNEHYRIHTDEKKYQCRYCPMRFIQSSGRRSHEYTKHTHTDRIRSCEYCEFQTSTTLDLKRHTLNEHMKRPRPFQCDMCSNRFFNIYLLRKHIETHNNVVKCKKCDQSFKRIELDKHMETHKDSEAKGNKKSKKIVEKPATLYQRFKSGEFSSVEYVDVSTIINDVSESEDQPCFCEICNKEFTNKTSLESHKRAFANKKPFKCGHCGKQFHIKICAKKHIIGHVNNNNSAAEEET